MNPGCLDWLLEFDNPSARYLTLTGLQDRPESDPQVQAARAAIAGWGPARTILDAQWPEGYWMQPGVGYSPKHKATVWQVIFLGALGAPRTGAVDRACAYVLDHSRLPDGRFSAYKTAKGAVACLNGNVLRAFQQLGYDDPRLEESLSALAEMVRRDRFCCRFTASPPPVRMAEGLPCAGGAVKALAALALIPTGQRSPVMQQAIDIGLEFLLGCDLAGGEFPRGAEADPQWLRFGFPPGGSSDLLEALEVLERLGLGQDSRLVAAREIVRDKQDRTGRWRLEHTPRNTWARFGRVGQPDKWVTLRAWRVLQPGLLAHPTERN